MSKSVEEICNLLVKHYSESAIDNASQPINISNKSLYSCVCCSKIEKYNPYQAFFNDENLYNDLERKITTELALAIDNNNVQRVKYIKNKYGHLNEFKNAKDFLNKKCKEVWNVYEPIKHLPKESMKALGITNQPELDFIFGNSIKHYEKDNSETTAYIIASTLKNQNLYYTIEDIHKYLKDMNRKQNCQYNFKTVIYLIKEQHYSRKKIYDLGIEKNIINLALSKLSLKYKLKFLLSK